MADQKISQLSSGAPAQAGDEYVVARSGSNYKLTLTNIAANMPATTVASGDLVVSSGNVGIGTSSPNITGFGSNTSCLTIKGTSTNGRGVLELASNGTTADGNSLGDLYFYDATNLNARISAARASSTTTGNLLFYTNGGSGNTERMRIDSSGNVGIGGTASAFAKVQTLGTLPTSSNITVANYNSGIIPSGTTSAAFGYYSALGTQAASFTLFGLYHNYVNPAAFGAGSTVSNQYGYYAESTLTGATNNYGFFSNIASGLGRWNFYASGTADNYFAGNVGVGRSPSYRLDVEQTADATTARFFSNQSGFLSSNQAVLVIDVNNPTPSSTSSFSIIADYNGVEQFKVRNDGTIYAQNTTVQSISDIRVKENVRNAAEGLSVINALRPVRFDFKEGFGNDRKNQLGFIAQEMELVFPDAVDVTGEEDDNGDPYKSVGPAALIPVLVKAIQELTARVAELESK